MNPSPIIELTTAYWKSRSFLAAIELGIFEHLGNEGQSLEHLSKATNVHPEKLKLLIGVLSQLKFVEVDTKNGDIKPSELSHIYLNPHSPAYMGHALKYAKEMYPLWDNIEAQLTSDITPPQMPSKKDTPSFLQSMHARAQMLAPSILKHLNFSEDQSLLDLAAGAGSWSFLIQQKFKLQKLTLLEQPELCADMEAFITQQGLQNATYVSSSYQTWSSHQQSFDQVIFFGALHQVPTNQLETTIEKIFSFVHQNGSLHILDLFYDQNEENSLFAYLFGLNMILTNGGSVHELKAIENILSKISTCTVQKTRVEGDMPYYLLSIKKES